MTAMYSAGTLSFVAPSGVSITSESAGIVPAGSGSGTVAVTSMNQPSASTATASAMPIHLHRDRAISIAAPAPAVTARHRTTSSNARAGTRTLLLPGNRSSNLYGPYGETRTAAHVGSGPSASSHIATAPVA